MVRRHVRRMYTWKSHDRVHRNQIGYILVQKPWWTSVRKCRSYPGADAVSDHDHVLVGLKFGTKLHKLPKRDVCTTYDFSETEQYTGWNFKTGSKHFRCLSPTTRTTWSQRTIKVKVVAPRRKESAVNGKS